MMLGRGTEGNDELLLIGLSKENIKRLQAGRPIRVTRQTHGEGVPEGWKILIMYGDTEGAMAAQLQASGVVGPETKIKSDPRLNS